ncbi:MAG: FtsX-like permease family protein [Leptolyngbya sp. SIO4C1]|nr:FtsX-like permease family protein [Leptolyngbya sp. SIO4C1]
MLLSIPLAWLQLIHQRVRFVVTLIGIAFVVALLFMQLGFQDALFNSAVRVHQRLRGDLFLVSAQYKSLTAQQFFPRSRLYQTLALPQVKAVSPLLMQFGKLKNIETGQKYSIFVFGISVSEPPFRALDAAQLDALKFPNKALFDRHSRAEFGPITARFEQAQSVQVEISSFNEIVQAHRYEIAGLFGLGTSFGIDGSLMVNDSAFLHTFPGTQAEEVSIGVIELQPGARAERVQAILSANLPDDVQILTREAFIALEKSYWSLRTPVGFTFRLMVTIGFIVGVGVAYQVLYTNISNHLLEYATLKAIGFRNRYLLNTVFQQAMILAILGFIPGLFIAVGVYDRARTATNLPILMTLDKSVTVLVSVIVMCTASGLFAIQKLRSADPADIF